MNSHIEELKKLDFSVYDEVDDIEEIYDLVDGFFDEAESMEPAEIQAVLVLFEHFPEDYSTHAFWSIVHGLEHFGGYESHLIESVHRLPSCMAIVMLGRFLNSGIDSIEGCDVRGLLQEIIERTDTIPQARSRAQRFLDKAK